MKELKKKNTFVNRKRSITEQIPQTIELLPSKSLLVCLNPYSNLDRLCRAEFITIVHFLTCNEVLSIKISSLGPDFQMELQI